MIHEIDLIVCCNILLFNSLEECQWSKKQAELFTAQQGNLLQINEKKALSPRQLQKTIMQIIKDIPDYSDIVCIFCNNLVFYIPNHYIVTLYLLHLFSIF